MTLSRDVRADRYGVCTVVQADGAPIKLELVHEDRIDVTGAMIDALPEYIVAPAFAGATNRYFQHA